MIYVAGVAAWLVASVLLELYLDMRRNARVQMARAAGARLALREITDALEKLQEDHTQLIGGTRYSIALIVGSINQPTPIGLAPMQGEGTSKVT